MPVTAIDSSAMALYNTRRSEKKKHAVSVAACGWMLMTAGVACMIVTVTFSGSGRTLSDQQLDDIAANIGVPIPDSLRSFYIQRNGGRPTPNIFIDANGDDYEVHSFKSFGEPGWAGVSIEDTYRGLVAKGLIPHDLIPFAMDSGGNPYCMNRSGEICFMPMDTPNREIVPIANTLDEFIGGLVSPQEAYG
jgi:hypothetical protein